MTRIKTLALTRGFKIAELSRMVIGPAGNRVSYIRARLQMDKDDRHWNLLLTDGEAEGLTLGMHVTLTLERLA